MKPKKRMGRPPVKEPKKKINLYFRPSFYAELQALAKSEGRTTSQLIEMKFAPSIKKRK